jgi:spore coat protein U-like protein
MTERVVEGRKVNPMYVFGFAVRPAQLHRCGRTARWLFAAGLAAVAIAVRAAPTCKNLSVTPVAFGMYSPVATVPLDAVGTITYKCAGALAPAITLSRGSAPTYSPREMRQGAQVLQYNLYIDAARTVIWGDGTGGSSTYTGTSGGAQSVPVYGSIFPLQDAGAGNYSDTIIVTINF